MIKGGKSAFRNFNDVLYLARGLLLRGVRGTIIVEDKNGKRVYFKIDQNDLKDVDFKSIYNKYMASLDSIKPDVLDFSNTVRVSLFSVKTFPIPQFYKNEKSFLKSELYRKYKNKTLSFYEYKKVINLKFCKKCGKLMKDGDSLFVVKALDKLSICESCKDEGGYTPSLSIRIKSIKDNKQLNKDYLNYIGVTE